MQRFRVELTVVAIALTALTGAAALFLGRTSRVPSPAGESAVHAAEAIGRGRYIDWARESPDEVARFRSETGLSLDEEFGIVAISKAIAAPDSCGDRTRAEALASDIAAAAGSVGSADADCGVRAIRAAAARAVRELAHYAPPPPGSCTTGSRAPGVSPPPVTRRTD